jgi:hypothetical protein
MRSHKVLTSAAILALLTSMLLVVPISAAPSQAGGSGSRQIPSGGTTSFQPRAAGVDGLQWPEFLTEPRDEGAAPQGANGSARAAQRHAAQFVNRSHSRRPDAGAKSPTTSALSVPVVTPSPIVSSNPGLAKSFDGLNLRDQRLANGGNQFTVEPPDQGLCVGNGYVMESVNDVLNVYSPSGASLLGVTDLNTFYGYPAQFDRTTGLQGPFVTDPSCLFDSDTHRWFHVVLTLDVFPDTGDFTGKNHLDLAVSNSANPLGTWTIYRLPVQDDGTQGTPNHHCLPGPPVGPGHHRPTNPRACIGDYPHIGADANGFYITTNEYPLFPPTGFHAAQIYAFSKRALAAGAPSVTVTQFDTIGAVGGQPGFTVWPAQSPPGSFSNEEGGTEYFLSSNAAEEATGVPGGGFSDKLIVWALTNTKSLDKSQPDLDLSNRILNAETYGIPPKSEQKPGDIPLGQCINDTTIPTPFGPGCWQYFFIEEPAHDEVESHLDSNDSRMQQVWFANGKLFGALDTIVNVGGEDKAGIAYFIVTPSVDDGPHDSAVLNAQIAKQGYVAVRNNNVTYPAIATLENGNGIMAFTLVGERYYPSAAYAPINTTNGTGDVHVAAAGAGPSDGFTSYKAFVGDPPRTRWGDYGAAVVDGNSIWIASEYIGQTCTLAQYLRDTAASPLFSCRRTRVALGNWGTRISRVNP